MQRSRLSTLSFNFAANSCLLTVTATNAVTIGGCDLPLPAYSCTAETLSSLPSVIPFSRALLRKAATVNTQAMSRDEGPREDGRDPPPDSEFKAFVGGISWHMNDGELKHTFRKYNARGASVMLDKMTGRSRGFGFVSFDNEDDLKEAVKNMHDSELDSRKISCTRAIPQSETAPGTPASALAGGPGAPSAGPRGRYGGGGGGGPRGGDRGYDRGYDRGPPRGYAARGYDDRRGYDRGGYGYGRPPERGYDRGGYGPPEYERGYERGGYGGGPPSYSGGYDRGEYGGGGGYGREPAGYSREGGGYGAERGYGGGGGYADAGYGAERGGVYSSGYPAGGGGGGAAFDRGYDDRAYGGRDAYSSRAPAAPAREGAYSRPGPERDYARPAARAPGPYERPMAGLPPR